MHFADEINHKTGEYHRGERSRYRTAAVDMADATYADNARKFLNSALGILVILREPHDSRCFVSYLFPIASETRLGRHRVLRKGKFKSRLCAVLSRLAIFAFNFDYSSYGVATTL